MKVFSKKVFLGPLVAVVGCLMATTNTQAQEFTVQGDLVSSYVWRGMYQTGASIQPTLGFTIGGFSLTAWGSTDFDGCQASEGRANKEIDLTCAYAFGSTGLTLSVADLWWPGKGRVIILNSKAMKQHITLKQDWLIRCRLKSFRFQLPGTRCLPDRIKRRMTGEK